MPVLLDENRFMVIGVGASGTCAARGNGRLFAPAGIGGRKSHSPEPAAEDSNVSNSQLSSASKYFARACLCARVGEREPRMILLSTVSSIPNAFARTFC